MFCENIGQTPIKLSKCFNLRPKYVKTVNEIPHNVCLCSYHDNVISAINAMNKLYLEFPEYGNSFLDTFLCDNPGKK